MALLWVAVFPLLLRPLVLPMDSSIEYTLSIDIETYSDRELGGPKGVGVHKYVESPVFDIELFGYSLNYGPVRVIDLADGERIPEEVLEMLSDRGVLKTAYNAPFERTCLAKFLGKPMPPEQWSCSMVLAAQVGLPLGLKAVCEAMGLPPDQAKKDGDALIRYFAKPCAPTIVNGGRTRNMPWDDYAKWERYKSYNKRDVEVENTIRKRLSRYIPSEVEQRFWCLDQKINDVGVRLDLELAKGAIRINDIYTSGLEKEVEELSGITNIKSTTQVKEWLEKKEGVVFDSINKKAMPEVREKLTTKDAAQLLTLRSELSKTSTAKFDKMLVCACDDDHARGLFQFYGANRTGRFAGRLLQLQNLPQNHLEDLADTRALVKAGSYEELRERHPNIASTLSELIRTALIPEPGCQFIVADFSAIEARVIAWITNEKWRLDVFRNGGDIYCASASQIFGVPVEKNGVNGHLRQRGKVAELALGYGGGIGAVRTMDTGRALINEPDEAIQQIVDGWRKASPNIVKWWRSLERAAKDCIRSKAAQRDAIGGIVFTMERGNMFVTLPSGRRLCYVNAGIGSNRFGNESIVYAGLNQRTHKWETLETYGGKLSENCVQAIARDCLRDCMLRMDELGFDIRAHVHDEVIVNEPIGGRTLDDLIAVMRQPPEWAKDLPLNAAGFTSDFYMKD